jgi:hypothetical protein
MRYGREATTRPYSSSNGFLKRGNDTGTGDPKSSPQEAGPRQWVVMKRTQPKGRALPRTVSATEHVTDAPTTIVVRETSDDTGALGIAAVRHDRTNRQDSWNPHDQSGWDDDNHNLCAVALPRRWTT